MFTRKGLTIIAALALLAVVCHAAFGAGSDDVLATPQANAVDSSDDTASIPDFDGDGTIGFGDFLEFAARFGLSQGDDGYDWQFDLNGDGSIGFVDFLILAENFGREAPYGRKGEFDIELVFIIEDLTDEDKQTIRQMADIWEEIIVGDLPESTLEGVGLIDDVLIYVNRLDPKSLAGGTGGVVNIRPSGLPLVGTIHIRPRLHDDLPHLGLNKGEPTYRSIVAHELLHALGFGTCRAFDDHVEVVDGKNYFTGSNALKAFDESVGGAAYQGRKIPMFDGVHWDDSVLWGDVMASDDGVLRISSVTVGALADMGYEVVPSTTPPVPIGPYGKEMDTAW